MKNSNAKELLKEFAAASFRDPKKAAEICLEEISS